MGHLVVNHASINHFHSFLIFGHNCYSCHSFSNSIGEKGRPGCISLGAKRHLDFKSRIFNYPSVQFNELTFRIGWNVRRNVRLFQSFMAARASGNNRGFHWRSCCILIEKICIHQQQSKSAARRSCTPRDFDNTGALSNYLRRSCSSLGFTHPLLGVKYGCCRLFAHNIWQQQT